MVTRCTSWAYVVAVLLLTLVSTAIARYSGGTGEPNDPYQIATAADLIALGENPNDYGKHFILTGDIDLDPNLPGRKVFDSAVIAPDTNDATAWFEGTPFTGVLDGNGHAISHLTIRGGGFLGLFGCLEWLSQVKNLGVVDVSITGSGRCVGGLVGLSGAWNGGGVITRCYSTGTISGGSGVGGLVGEAYYGSMTQCCSSGAVSGDSFVGGLLGSSSGDCEDFCGGAVVEDCYSNGPVTGSSYVGGLVGETYGAVTHCYSVGVVHGTGEYGPVGGLVGQSNWRSPVTECFWDIQASGQATSAGGMGKTTTQMQSADTFFAWGVCGHEGVWTIEEGKDYPRLRWENKPGEPIQAWLYLPGKGTWDSPYLIYTPQDLDTLGKFPCENGKHFRLMEDIDLSHVAYSSAPIPSFAGTFDGNGHTISHLTIKGGSYLGLFGQLWTGAEVQDLRVVDVNIVGSRYGVGALAGSNAGAVTRCHSSGVVSGNDNVGGLVGWNSSEATIGASCGGATVIGLSGVGGLVGSNWGGTVSQCYSTGAVSGDSGVGGLVGENYGTVTQCYSTGTITGTGDSVGGLAGLNGSTVTHCYSAGAVSGQLHVGGFIGRRSVGGTIDSRSAMVLHNVWDMETSGQPGSDGGVGLTRSQMMNPSMLGLNGFANDPNWVLDAGHDYPRLAWQGTPGQTIPEPDIDWLEGQGTGDAPYRIDTAEQLMLLACASALWGQHFALGADIDLDPALPGRQVFDQAPIQVFTGTFDGNGHTVSHMTIKGAGDLGLFGRLGFGTKVRNVGVVDVNITGSGSCIGGLAGRCDGEVINCYSIGAVTGNDYVGGLLGCDAQYSVAGIVGSISGDLVQCYSTGTVSGNNHVGGLVGSKCGTVRYCYSTCTVSGASHVGGLAGYAGYDGEVTRCYSTGTVSGTSYVGGLAGHAGKVANCYSIGAVTGKDYVGGLLGSGNANRVTTSFWNIETSRQSTSPGGTGKTTAEMRDIQTYLDTGWDFVGEIQNGIHETWQMPPGGGYPMLAIRSAYIPPQLQGSGSPEDPYVISNALELGAMIYYSSDAHYRLAADIDLAGIHWGTAVIPRIAGTFDGNNLTISHLTIKGGSYLGLFGQVTSGGEVKKIGLVDVDITGSGEHVGGVAGCSRGRIDTCYSTGYVWGTRSVGGLVGMNMLGAGIAASYSGADAFADDCYVGGLAGRNYGSIVMSRSTGRTGTVGENDGVDYVGGLVGWNSPEASVTASHNAGTVTGDGHYAGGAVGYNCGSIAACYNAGRVHGSWRVGGLVGGNSGGITACYNTGMVLRNGCIGGGLVGINTGSVSQCYSTAEVGSTLCGPTGGLVAENRYGDVRDSFWDTQTSRLTVNDGGTGRTTGEMQTAKTFLDAGWDFVDETANGTEDIWWILEGKDYPRLWWELGEAAPE